MPGRRRVEDDEIEAVVLTANERAHPIEERDFLRGRHRRRQVNLPVGFLQDGVAEQVGDVRLDAGHVALGFGRRVDFHRMQAGCDLEGLRTEGAFEDV